MIPFLTDLGSASSSKEAASQATPQSQFFNDELFSLALSHNRQYHMQYLVDEGVADPIKF